MSERWALRGCQIRADDGRGPHVGTYQRERIEGVLMAAAPELLDMLIGAAETLDDKYPAAAQEILGRIIDLGLSRGRIRLRCPTVATGPRTVAQMRGKRIDFAPCDDACCLCDHCGCDVSMHQFETGDAP